MTALDYSNLGYHVIGYLLLVLGLLFDLLSLAAAVTTWRGRYSSGFPLVGACFYLSFIGGAALGWFKVMAFAHSVLIGVVLLAIHTFIQGLHTLALRKLRKAR